MKRFFCAIVLIALCSCSSEKASETAAGGQPGNLSAGGAEKVSLADKAQYSLKVVPADATRRSILTAVPAGFKVTDSNIEWIVNGGPSVGSGPAFDTSSTKKGDRVQARAMVGDSQVLSDAVEIKNTPPELTKVKIMPEIFKPGDTLHVEAAAADDDGDDVAILYEWTKNGEPAGDGKTIASPLKRGDKITVKVTPFDGQSYGNPIVRKTEVQNIPPMITEHYDANLDGRKWSFQVKASDPDGDTLEYSLKASPPGMSIDPATGLVTWEIPRDFQGKTSVTVSVKDGHGGEATHAFNVTIKR